MMTDSNPETINYSEKGKQGRVVSMQRGSPDVPTTQLIRPCFPVGLKALGTLGPVLECQGQSGIPVSQLMINSTLLCLKLSLLGLPILQSPQREATALPEPQGTTIQSYQKTGPWSQ